MPTTIRSLAALALSTGALAGCATFGSLFPSHEDVFTPIGPTVGAATLFVAAVDGPEPCEGRITRVTTTAAAKVATTANAARATLPDRRMAIPF